MKLFIVRHGDALSSAVDKSRPLSKEGRLHVQKIRKMLTNIYGDLDVKILHSPKTRAIETAEIISPAFRSSNLVEDSCLLPNADPMAILVDIKGSDNDMVLVSHLPFVPNLLGLLVPREQVYSPSTGECIVIEDGNVIEILK